MLRLHLSQRLLIPLIFFVLGSLFISNVAWVKRQDEHPVGELAKAGDREWERYIQNRSLTFTETVDKYRARYGRHPPPRFKQWYKFARRRGVYNIDDFVQIHDDLRPFWALTPQELRRYTAHASDDPGHGVSTIKVRNGQVLQITSCWRSETFIDMLQSFAKWLPDMDIPMNRMDQPRVVVTWKDMQHHLEVEKAHRSLLENGIGKHFTKNMNSLFTPHFEPQKISQDVRNPSHLSDKQPPPLEERPDYGWFAYQGQQFMKIASQACPPESYARTNDSEQRKEDAEHSYKSASGGFITNFNRSSDLCTVGPTIQNLHGLLYASTSMLATQKLVPIFSECKTNVNSDILFPANMYWKRDPRYEYDDQQDIEWDDKDDMMIWRGVTSGGTAFEDLPQPWKNMHRQRLVQLLNSTFMVNQTVAIIAQDPANISAYTQQPFKPSTFASMHSSVGFTEKVSCLPNCSFYDSSLHMLNQTTFPDTFRSKYLIDVDGHSFSGRWRAFLQSRSLGLKATIFREWHDTRLFAWRHFVPVDNRYDDLYSLLTYFVGNAKPRVARHDFEGMQIARQGREWAAKVLRREDMEVYVFRLLLEYARLVDDNRDRIGVVGNGGEEMATFDHAVPAVV